MLVIVLDLWIFCAYLCPGPADPCLLALRMTKKNPSEVQHLNVPDSTCSFLDPGGSRFLTQLMSVKIRTSVIFFLPINSFSFPNFLASIHYLFRLHNIIFFFNTISSY